MMDRPSRAPRYAIESGESIWGTLRDVLQDVDRQANGGLTALHSYALSGDDAVVALLCKHNASVNMPDHSGWSPIHFAAINDNVHITKALISSGAHRNFCDNIGRTPLHRAAIWGSYDTVKYLLDQKADPMIQDDFGDTAIDFACEIGEIELARVLLDAAKSRINLTKKSQMLYRAVEKGLNEIAELILQYHADLHYCSSAGGNSLLHVAAAEGNLEFVCKLLNHDNFPYINYKNKAGFTPLHLACSGGYTEVAFELIKHGANISEFDAEGNAPVHLAAIEGVVELMQILIDFDPNTIYSEALSTGKLAIHVAAEWGHDDVIQLLLRAGCDPDALDANGHTSLHLACSWAKAKVAKVLIENGANVNYQSPDGYYPLHRAAVSGGIELAVILLEANANPTYCAIQPTLPPHDFAYAQGLFELGHLLESKAQELNNLQSTTNNVTKFTSSPLSTSLPAASSSPCNFEVEPPTITTVSSPNLLQSLPNLTTHSPLPATPSSLSTTSLLIQSSPATQSWEALPSPPVTPQATPSRRKIRLEPLQSAVFSQLQVAV